MDKIKLFITYSLIFLATLLILNWFQKPESELPANQGDVVVDVLKSSIAQGKDIRLNVYNNTAEPLVIPSQCPDSYFTISQWNGEAYELVTDQGERDCSNIKDVTVPAGKKLAMTLQGYSYTAFSELGRYRLSLTVGEETFTSQEFEVREPSLLTKLWRVAIFNPILNLLVGLIILLPGHSLGLAIVALTIIIRTILLAPSIKALRAQKRMQELQPKLEELKTKYKDDQARLAQETMHLWKSHKVNPLSSCMPILIQFPILIALFAVISQGLTPDRSVLIYNFLPDFHLADIDPLFLGLNLFNKNLIVLPLIIAALQFAQMQLMVMQSNKKKKAGDKSVPSEVENANKMMRYVMPVMIGVFTAQLPAAVGLYWGTSTFYGILQQLMINKEGPSGPTIKSEDDVQVRIINKKHG